jgi:hypothetical protein
MTPEIYGVRTSRGKRKRNHKKHKAGTNLEIAKCRLLEFYILNAAPCDLRFPIRPRLAFCGFFPFR